VKINKNNNDVAITSKVTRKMLLYDWLVKSAGIDSSATRPAVADKSVSALTTNGFV